MSVLFHNVVCKKATDKALLCEVEGEELWIPLSQVNPDSEVFDDDRNNQGTLVITEWIAKQKGLI